MERNKKGAVKHLETIALYLEITNANAFRINAFKKAARALETDPRSLDGIEDLTAISGIGKGTKDTIEEWKATGTSAILEDLKKEVPATLLELLKIPGLGGKKIAKLYEALGVTDTASLKAACEEGRVSGLAGFGKKTEEKILHAIEQGSVSGERTPIAEVEPLVRALKEALAACSGIIRFEVAGSYRRMEETVKDLDWVISTDDVEAVRAYLLALPSIAEVIGAGDTKVSVTFTEPVKLSCDFRLVKDEHYPTTLHHFTGSKDHNVRLRQIAKARGESISEYGVTVEETGELLTFADEIAFFQHFDLPWIAPSMRQGAGEFDQADVRDGAVRIEQIVSDLHMHSTWSDGAYTVREMADYAASLGRTHIAMTDHGQFLKVANGLTPERLRAQGEEIDALNRSGESIPVLKGIEMDILPDGSLDFNDEVLSELEWVVASIHSGMQADEETIMTRLEAAVSNPYVDVIGHPTGRIIGRREGYAVNMPNLVALCAKYGKILELNSNPHRLDLNVEHLRLCVEAGVRIAINTDAHNKEMLHHTAFGVAQAMRAFVPTEFVVNTWTLEQLREYRVARIAKHNAVK
ncbi:MAG: DNA polymerase/3'-5' exonuclease PolX [Bacilli bacterium]